MMLTIDRFVPISKAKNSLLDLARDVERDDDVVAITRNGVPAAILLSPAKYEALLETLEILGDSRTMWRLRRSMQQAAAGKWVGESGAFGRK
jgi:antitoxin YefM